MTSRCKGFIILFAIFYTTPGETVSKAQLYSAVQSAVQYAENQQRIQEEHAKGNTRTEKSPSDFHAGFQRSESVQFDNVGRAGYIMVETARYLQDVYNISYDSDAYDMPPGVIEFYAGESICPHTPICALSKYRTIDGSCNNLKHPSWGQSFLPMARLLPPAYDDGLSTPRTKGKDGSTLPNARLVSTTLAPDRDVPSDYYTIMVMQFGQFLAHDMTHGNEDPVLDCCNKKIMEEQKLKHVDCFNIDIPDTDTFYSQYNQTCLKFVRTQPAVGVDCQPGPRQQVNILTSVIDASQVYGSNKNLSDSLRTFQRGELKSNPDDPRVLPPGRPKDCNTLLTEKPCLTAGDARVNEMMTLSVLHQLFFREHNRIAPILAELNPCLGGNDEIIYQETRRIVAAISQHITYNEFLPIILGNQTMKAFNLSLLNMGYWNEYDENVDPTIVNSFGAAAFRVGHTLIQGHLDLMDENRIKRGNFSLAQTYNRPIPLYYEDMVTELIIGLATEPSQKVDLFFTDAITNHLFQVINQSYGLDLIAFNIQRGRERGLPPYVRFRKFCGLGNITSFNDLNSYMYKESVPLFQKLYRNVEDIDLFIGAMSEIPEPGEVLPPTVKCILSIQFQRLKFGDRFWYENGKDRLTAFTEDQLKEIRKVSLAGIFCANSRVAQMQKNVFIQPSERNPLFKCSDIAQMNFTSWRICL